MADEADLLAEPAAGFPYLQPDTKYIRLEDSMYTALALLNERTWVSTYASKIVISSSFYFYLGADTAD